MADKTTEGVFAEPEEVEAVLHNLCGYHLSERDPVHRYTVLTREQVLYDGLVAAIRRERGRALAEMVDTGHSMTQVAAMTNLRTRQRVQRLIAIARAADEAVAKVQAASLEFEQRLAAVEATLDQVHSDPLASGDSPADRDPPAKGGPPAREDGAGRGAPAGHEDGEDRVVLEPTRALPALTAVLNPTRELPGEGTPEEAGGRWWRRGRDPGAA